MSPPSGRATLDFFEAQARARARTRLLIVLFALALVAVVAVVYAAALVIDSHIAPAHTRQGLVLVGAGFTLIRPGLLATTALVVASLVAGGGGWHALQLASGGGEAVAQLLGGRRIERGTADPLERKLVNVAEEMAIAAGLPVPALYVLDREAAINAFAAGYTPGHAAVAVTRGALVQLDRDELQGVVAHELSHVLHADTRIDLQLMAVVGGLGILSLLGRALLAADSGEGGRHRRANPFALLGVALLVAGGVGTLCGKLVRYGVARQREWLADASAVQFTRNPDGLASALHRIGEEGSTVLAPMAAEAAHLFFASATSGFLEGLFSTHPPLAERIRRIAPGFQGRPRQAGAPAGASPAPGPGPSVAPLAAAPLAHAVVPGAAAAISSPARGAATLLARLPEPALLAARDPFGARCLSCALLLDAAATPAGAAGRELLRRADGGIAAEVERLADALAGRGRVERMALLALALPALDGLSPAQTRALAADLRALAGVDGALSPFELAVQRVVQRRLLRDAGAPPRPTLRTVEDAGPEALELLATLAWTGARDGAAAQAALDAGVHALGQPGRWRLPAREGLDLGRLDRTLERLDGAAPRLKATLLAATGAVALADGRLTLDEAELVRAVAAALGLPMPHLGPGGPAGNAPARRPTPPAETLTGAAPRSVNG